MQSLETGKCSRAGTGKQRLRDLANDTSALDLKRSAAAVWLLNGEAADLANNNSVSGKVFVIEALPRRRGLGKESCKQQPAGAFFALPDKEILRCLRSKLQPVDRKPMPTSDQINDLHRLYVSENWPIRKIERHLKMGWKTIKKYLETPAQGAATRERRSKLDPFNTHGKDSCWIVTQPPWRRQPSPLGAVASLIFERYRGAPELYRV